MSDETERKGDPTVSSRVDPWVDEALQSLMPMTRRADGRSAYKSDVLRAVLTAVLERRRLDEIVKLPGETFADRIGAAIDAGLNSLRDRGQEKPK